MRARLSRQQQSLLHQDRYLSLYEHPVDYKEPSFSLQREGRIVPILKDQPFRIRRPLVDLRFTPAHRLQLE